MIDISWSTLLKLLVTALGTYALLPAVLIFRDFIIWKLIGRFILNDELHKKIDHYARLVDNWNANYVGDFKEVFEDGEAVYYILGKKASFNEWKSFFLRSDQVSRQLRETEIFINRKSKLMDLMLKHYKQDGENPIGKWKSERINKIKKAKD